MGYETRIRRLFSFYDSIHTVINFVLRSVLEPESDILVVGCGTGSEILELGKTNLAWHFAVLGLCFHSMMLPKASSLRVRLQSGQQIVGNGRDSVIAGITVIIRVTSRFNLAEIL